MFDNDQSAPLITLPCVTNVAGGDEDHVSVVKSGSEIGISSYDSVGAKGCASIYLNDPRKIRDLANVLIKEARLLEQSQKAPVRPAFSSLSAQAQKIFLHMQRAGSISAREAMNDYGITSAALARRVCDIEETGFGIARDRKDHPVTGKRYTRYSLAPVQLSA